MSLGISLGLVGLLFIVGTTLIPIPEQSAASAATPLWCLVCGEYGGVDVLNNILLFIPLALGLRLYGYRTARVVIMGALLSLVVEVLQLTIVPGRDASLSDLVTNSLGSWLGAKTGERSVQLLFPNPRIAGALTLIGALAWLAVQTSTAVLLRPWSPSEIRGGAWGRAVPGRVRFDGEVRSAVVSGFSIQDELRPLPGLARRLRLGDVRLETQLVSGRVRPSWSPVVEVLGSDGSILSLMAVGRDFAFHAPMQSSRLRLRRPGLRLPGALPSEAGVPVRVVARADDDTLKATWSIAEGPVSRSLQVLSPSLGWSLITPVPYAFGPEARWITGLWIAGWLGVVGYWAAARRAAPLSALSRLALLLFTGLVLVPLVTGYSVSQWTEWVAAAAGVGFGYAGHHFAAYFGEGCESLSVKESC
jgi:hypothetical protein